MNCKYKLYFYLKRKGALFRSVLKQVSKFDENMEALKHNFLTRRYFKKIKKEDHKK